MPKQILQTGSIIYWDKPKSLFLWEEKRARICIKVTCCDCGNDRWIPLSNLKKQMRNPLYTGRCVHCWKSKSWKDKGRLRPEKRKITEHGYIKIWNPENSMADKRGEVYEHRLIMSQILGRPLQRWEHVHHKDGNKANNIPENLELHPNSEHITIKDMKARIKYLEDLLHQNHISF